jgi:hypothetical protein
VARRGRSSPPVRVGVLVAAAWCTQAQQAHRSNYEDPAITCRE